MKHQEQDEKVEIFHYPKSVFTPLWIGALLPPISFVLDFYSWRYSIGAGLIFLFYGLFFSVLIILRPIQLATIIISDRGIAAHRYGRIWRFIPWTAIKKIVRVRDFSRAVQKPLLTYYVQDTERNLQQNLRAITSNYKKGPLTFSERILDYRKLLDLINEFAGQNNIKLVEIDRLDASRKSQTFWRQLEPKEQEVDVQTL